MCYSSTRWNGSQTDVKPPSRCAAMVVCVCVFSPRDARGLVVLLSINATEISHGFSQKSLYSRFFPPSISFYPVTANYANKIIFAFLPEQVVENYIKKKRTFDTRDSVLRISSSYNNLYLTHLSNDAVYIIHVHSIKLIIFI